MKSFLKIVILMMLLLMLISCGTNNNEVVERPQQSDIIENNISKNAITEEMAYEGVSNYCHDTYDWNETDSNMYVSIGDESETEYQIIFRSYTGSFVYFYVSKTNGTTRMIEYVPTLEIESEAGTINIYDYLDK